MPVVTHETLTPRESVLLEADKEESRLSREHALKMKELDIEVQKLEAKWSAWFRIPIMIIKLPVWLIMGVGYCIAVARKVEPTDKFWNYLG